MTTTVDTDSEVRRLQAALTHAEHARDVYAARLNGAATYVKSLRSMSANQRYELLALLLGNA